ncbi:MAG: ABC transporter permease [Burkholderiales bacterium]|nr:ABC transporter permease [Burkholderiales bacterium]
MLSTHVKAAWRSGWRSRSARLLFILSLFVLLAAWVGGSFSPRQPQTVALDVGISLVRLLGTLLAIFWVQDLVGKDVERRSVLFILAYPHARAYYLAGRYLGVMVLVAFALALMSIALLLFVKLVAPDYHQMLPPVIGSGYVLTIALAWLDIAVVAAFALFVASVSTVPMLPVFVGGAFAVSARTLGTAIEYVLASRPTEFTTTGPMLKVITWILPDLDRLDIRQSVLYNSWPPSGEIAASIVMALSYILVFYTLSVIVFSRREFT